MKHLKLTAKDKSTFTLSGTVTNVNLDINEVVKAELIEEKEQLYLIWDNINNHEFRNYRIIDIINLLKNTDFKATKIIITKQ